MRQWKARLLRLRYKTGSPIRSDLAHLVNARTMERPPQMLESGTLQALDGSLVTYHDVRLFFPAPPKPAAMQCAKHYHLEPDGMCSCPPKKP